jgi:protein involved in polysaccharide export with SLBB domain
MEKKKSMMEQSKIQSLQPTDMVITPLEKAIDPDTYIVGPGDQFGVNINTIENFNFILSVGPAGDVLIPTVGVVDVNKKSLREAIQCIKKFIVNEGYKTADVYVSLINVRHFKIQVAGAVNEPGFCMVTPLTRLDEIVEMSMDFHPYAKEHAIEIKKHDGKTLTVDFTNYLLTGNLENNPYFSEGDKIFIPFKDNIRSDIQPHEIIDIYTEKGVSVNGFVQVPGSYKYFPGYTCADYVGLAGGNSIEGNVNRAVVKHTDGTVEKGPDVIIQRGDLIIVPRSLTQWLMGNTSIFQIIVSAASVYMSYLAATK